MFSKCVDLIDFCLLVSESLCFVIFIAYRRGSLVWISSSIASTSTIVEASIKLHSGCILIVVLLSVFGQIIYLVLVI